MSNIASFQLNKYLFNHVKLEFETELPDEVSVDFIPKGIFKTGDKTFHLEILFTASPASNKDNPFVEIKCKSVFGFQNVNSIDEVPGFFFKNAIAILFPYIRAFVSTVTLQANIPPLVLPTYNLSDLEEPLRKNTITQ